MGSSRPFPWSFGSPCRHPYARTRAPYVAMVGDAMRDGAKVASALAPATVIIIRPALQKTRGAKRRDSSLIPAYRRNPLSLLVLLAAATARRRSSERIRFTLLSTVQGWPTITRAAARATKARAYARFVRASRFRRFAALASANSPRATVARDYNSATNKAAAEPSSPPPPPSPSPLLLLG